MDWERDVAKKRLPGRQRFLDRRRLVHPQRTGDLATYELTRE